MSNFKDWLETKAKKEFISAMNEGSTGDDHEFSDPPSGQPLPKEFQKPKNPEENKPKTLGYFTETINRFKKLLRT